MIEKFISGVTKWVSEHLSPRPISAIAFITGFLLFAPDRLLVHLELQGIARSYKGIIALGFIGSAFFLATYPISMCWSYATAKIRRYGGARKLRENFDNLASDQISILLEYVQTGKNSIHFSPTNGAVQDLVYKGILYRPFQRIRSDGLMAYNVTAQAAEFLRHDRFQEVLNRNKNQSSPAQR